MAGVFIRQAGSAGAKARHWRGKGGHAVATAAATAGIVPGATDTGNAPARCRTLKNAARSAAFSTRAAAGRATSTKAPVGNCSRVRRKLSRNTRLIRLRPTACGSTLRDTANPSRAGRASCIQCRLSNGCAKRRLLSNTRVNSLRARTRAMRGSVACVSAGAGTAVEPACVALITVAIMLGSLTPARAAKCVSQTR
jgi:hypothetical protein